MAAENSGTSVAAPYATGGGGVVLEHRYGASLLASLLTGDPLTELGDDAVPVEVRFQAAAVSAVDDLLVTGRTQDGGERKVSIGVRRDPALTSRDAASARLLGSYLAIVAAQREEVAAGRWRLALAVASPNPAVRQVRELADIARATVSEDRFRTEVARPGRTSQAVRNRLGHLDALALAGLRNAGIEADTADARELTWRMLAALYVRELRLEGADQSDRTTVVAQLRRVTSEGTLAGADVLFMRLEELVGQYAPAGAEVTEQILRRDLSGIPLVASSVLHPGTAPPGIGDSAATVSTVAEEGRLRSEFVDRLYEEDPDALSRWIASKPIGLRIGIDSSWDLHQLVDFLERAGYLETREMDNEEQVCLTDAGRREVTKIRAGARPAAIPNRPPDTTADDEGRLRSEFMERLYEEDPDALSRWIASEPIGLRIGIDSSWDLHQLVDFLERAGYLETREMDNEEQVCLTDAGRREVAK
jgi:predicted transcriptional regulator